MNAGLTFYLAGRYTRREELVFCANDLRARGHRVPARWLLGEHQVHGIEAARTVENPDGMGARLPVPEARLFAMDDVEDVLEADVVVSFTEAPRSGNSRGGRHVEYGIALGQRLAGQMRRLFIVGPRENVFHALDNVDGAFDTWREFLAHLDVQPRIHGWSITGNERCDLHPWHITNGYHTAYYRQLARETADDRAREENLHDRH